MLSVNRSVIVIPLARNNLASKFHSIPHKAHLSLDVTIIGIIVELIGLWGRKCGFYWLGCIA